MGKVKKTFFKRLSALGTFSLITLLKFVCEDKSSVFALIRSAFAPAREDSDWAKSVKVISPFCNLALSDSTCLSNKFTFEILNFLFSVLNIKS